MAIRWFGYVGVVTGNEMMYFPWRNVSTYFIIRLLDVAFTKWCVGSYTSSCTYICAFYCIL